MIAALALGDPLDPASSSAAPHSEHSCVCLKYVALKLSFLLFLFQRENSAPMRTVQVRFPLSSMGHPQSRKVFPCVDQNAFLTGGGPSVLITPWIV